MKETFLSLIRHALIALLSLGAFLSSRGMIAPEDAAAVNASGATILEAISVVVLAVVMRLMMKFSGKVISAHVNDGKNDGGNLLLLLGVAGLLGLGLPSCSQAQMDAARSVPIKACYIDKNGNRACYSSKGGIEVEVIGDK